MVAGPLRDSQNLGRMNFLKRLFGAQSAPTVSWPVLPPATPLLDLSKEMAGPLRFNTPFNEAQVFGRPDECIGNPAKNGHLHYVRAGFSLEYEAGLLVFVTYFIGPDEFAPKHDGLIHSRPQIVVPNRPAGEIHVDSTAEDLVAVFGPPESAEVEEDESVLTWSFGNLTVEAELGAQARMRRLNVFLTR